VGRCFRVFGADQNPERQGTVLSAVGPAHFLIQYFEWAWGAPSTMAVVSVETMAATPPLERSPGAWQFYESEGHMCEWFDQHVARPAD
jgi:hypothetical protein